MDFEEDIYTSVFSALKHPVRRKILRMLYEAPATYTEILNRLGVETGFLNYHLENLKGLVSKGIDGRYRLSEFGEVTLSFIRGIEEPVKRKSGKVSLFGLRINLAYISLTIAAFLVFSNVYWIYAYQGLSRDRLNTLGEVLLQAREFLSESIGILNSTLEKSEMSFFLVDVLHKDLIQLSRQLKFTTTLDTGHREQWSQINGATDSLIEIVEALIYSIRARGLAISDPCMNITYGQLLYLEKIRDDLIYIERKAFPAKIVIGSNPQVDITDSEITEAMEASLRLKKDVESARIAFNLPIRGIMPK
ncbi:winged helix-turn-helix transcriptional regulator [Candidatus Bathyarchaeota archaeon]|nr:winged helix-turn-helix transcriptional regulator [Candidatus Bathyarchaeota archaeon]